jgi:hypothetical protein
MPRSVDNKKYATDTRRFDDVMVNDKIVDKFEPSPVSERCLIKDICIYKPGDLNKIGKEGKTSWDSFSYAIQMGHNVYTHINVVQTANQIYQSGKACPNMLVNEVHSRIYVKDIIEEVFSDLDNALDTIEKYDRILTNIIGTRGLKGKKETNARTMFNQLFDVVDSDSADVVTADEEDLLDADLLDKLESTQEDKDGE